MRTTNMLTGLNLLERRVLVAMRQGNYFAAEMILYRAADALARIRARRRARGEKCDRGGARIEWKCQRLVERLEARRALKLLRRAVGDERDPKTIAEQIASGGLWTWPREADEPESINRLMCEVHQWRGGRTTIQVRVDDAGQVLPGAIVEGITKFLVYAMAHSRPRHLNWPGANYFAAIRDAVRSHCGEVQQ